MKSKKDALKCFAGTTLLTTFHGYGYSLYYTFLAVFLEYSGFSATQGALLLSISMFAGLFANMFLGTLYEKISPKILCSIFGLSNLVLFGSMVLTKNFFIICVAAVFWGLVNVICGQQCHMIMVNRWFASGTGTLMTIISLVRKGIQIVLFPAVAAAITAYGYKSTILAVSGGFTVIVVLSSIFLVNNGPASPEDRVTLIEKKQKEKKTRESKVKPDPIPDIQMAPKQLVRIPAVWLALVVPSIAGLATTMFTSNMSLIYTDMGCDLMQIALLSSIASAVGMVLGPLFGILSDIIGAKRTVVLYFGIGAIVFLCYPMLGGFLGCVMLAVGYNFGSGNASMSYPGIVLPTIVGRSGSSYLIGWSLMLVSLTTTFAPTLAAGINNATGSYRIPMLIAGLLFVATVILTLLATSPKVKAHVAELDQKARASAPASEQ